MDPIFPPGHSWFPGLSFTQQGSRSILRASLFVFPSPNFSLHQGGAVPLASLLAVSILRRAHHQASVCSSRSTRVLASSAARAQAARFLRFFGARLAHGPCHPSCLDSFFLPRLIWCMLLIRFCLAPGFTQAASRARSALIFLAVFSHVLLILSYLFCCGLLQGEAGIVVLELSNQKTRCFLVQIAFLQ
jgi:hypothetical protein